MKARILIAGLLLGSVFACSKSDDNEPAPEPPPAPSKFDMTALTVDGNNNGFSYTDVKSKPTIRVSFAKDIKPSSIERAVSLSAGGSSFVPVSLTTDNRDSTIVIVPGENLSPLTQFTLRITSTLEANDGSKLASPVNVALKTPIDSTAKFPLITDDSLLTLVQKQTFRYFWDLAHPVSGLARERNTSGDVVTSGGSGFGIMAIVTAIHRGFITRNEGLERMKTIVGFLGTKAARFHGAFPHWLDGATGAVQPFSATDNGADLVETSYLVQGLLTARQYFNRANADEQTLRNDINAITDAVEWNWFRKQDEQVLYWHWSPNYQWQINMQIKGWNECLITYVLGASSKTFSVPKTVYDNGWASNGGMKNGAAYYGYTLPLGPALGGPLFFAHYSFLGIDPRGLADPYANYQVQNTNHTLINYSYCVANPKSQYGYSDRCWGLTASDIKNGYTASSPTNDLGFIAPTAAISSLPYTPAESMKALKFFYYQLGDRIWKEYGFTDAFSLKDIWFADSFLAIDQGPIIVMIENHRSGLLWELFTSCPEVKTGMKTLGFSAPYL